ncbi:MAG TPA: hypothetical protein VLM40_01605, partial [Gemmata sp.]|nr:hypothetical protein [Gemmata sp.]
MPPVLHADYTHSQAVAAFGPETAVWFCEGQFALLPSAVLCFITIGSGWQPSAIGTPSRVTWYPPDDGDNTLGKFESFRRSDEEDERIDRYPWFPKSVRETWSAEQKKQVREHHIFLRAAVDTTFVYAGPAHLGSLGDGRGG